MHHSPSHRWPWKLWVLAGYALVALPLLAAFILAARSQDETARLGSEMARQIHSQTRTIHQLLERISDVERKARLFVLLSDPAVRQPYERAAYEKVRDSFQESLAEFRRLSLDNSMLLLANELSQKEALIHQQLLEWAARSTTSPAIDQAFRGLRESADALSQQFDRHVDRQLQALSAQTEANRKSLSWQTGILAAVSLGILLLVLARFERSLSRHYRTLEAGCLARSPEPPSNPKREVSP